MNHIYRVVFNQALGLRMVASELTRGRGSGRQHACGAWLTASTLALLLVAGSAFADGGAGGDAAGISGSGGAGGIETSPNGGDGANFGGGGGGGVSWATGAGGVGGTGGSGAGPGGSGGAGGALALLTDSTSPGVNTSPLIGGAGGQGANGSGIPSGGGGGGGGGGFGWAINATGASSTTATVTGGRGGIGGMDGGGGQGGGGVLVTNGGDFTTSQMIAGGAGGDGGRGDFALSLAGGGGDGGAGVVLRSGGSVTTEAGGAITGGLGGNGGNTDGVIGGRGGDGGAGVVSKVGGRVTIEAGTAITGGEGGIGGTSASASTADGPDGAGGIGVYGSNFTIINSGTIAGGLSGDGSTRANAIEFTGGTNRLELSAGSVINGNVDATASSDDTFALGGAANSNFDVSQIGGTAQYQGFESFEKTGTSTWTLTGTTAAATPWTLTAGTLSVSADANLGSASGGLSFDGGTLANTTAFTTGRAITLNAGGGTFQTDADLTANGVITGPGSLTKTGNDALTLSGANSYAGGTAINDGGLHATVTGALGTGPVVNQALLSLENTFSAETLQIINSNGINFRDDSSAGAASITNDLAVSFNDNSTAGNATIVNNGLLDFYHAASAGAATITITNGGATRFYGDNTADNATIINKAGGRVEIANMTTDGIGIGSLSGDGDVYIGSKTLTLGGLGWDDTIGGVIADGTSSGGGGTGGSLTKTGAGTLTLTGANTYTGVTTINAGILRVEGSIASSSLVTVNDGSTLGGSGTVGGVALENGGTITPGNSIGTLNVAGDVTFAAGSIYEVEVDPAGTASDLIHATGTATLNGGSVIHIGEIGTYQPSSTYTILTADGGLTGSFADVTSHFAFLDPTLIYDPNNVALELVRNDIAFADAARTRNQRVTASGIESLSASSAVYDAIVTHTGSDAALRESYDRLSGELHASTRTALLEDSRFVREAANERLRFTTGDTPAAMAHGDETAPHAIGWVRPFGNWGHNDGNGNAASLDRDTQGIIAGVDTQVSEHVRVGLLTGYSQTDLDAGDGRGSADIDSAHAGVYAGAQYGALALRGGAFYSHHAIDTQRHAQVGSFSQRLDDERNADTLQAYAELAYAIDTGRLTLEPFANLAHVRLHSGSEQESGGDAALRSASRTSTVTFTTLGVRPSLDVMLGSTRASLYGSLGWRHAFGDTTPELEQRFAGGDAFTIAGTPIAENAAVIEAGIGLSLNERASLNLSYGGQYGDGMEDHSGRAMFEWRF